MDGQRRVQETTRHEDGQIPMMGDGVAPTETYDVSLLKRALEMQRADAEAEDAEQSQPPGAA